MEQLFLLKFSHETKLWCDLKSFLELKPLNTQAAIRIALKDFLTFHKKDPETLGAADFICECTGQDVIGYLAEMRARGKSPATIQNRGFLLKTIFNWLVKSKYRDTLPNFDVPTSREQIRPTRKIDFVKIRAVIKSELRKLTPAGLEAAAFFSCLFYGALRRSEGLSLTLNDVIPKNDQCVLWLRHTKAQKSSEVLIGPEGAWIILEWVKVLRMNGFQNEDKLFSYNQSSAYRLFREKFGCGPHAARAAAITAALIDSPGELDAIADWARLSSFRLLRVYDKRIRSLEGGPGSKISFKPIK